MRRSNSADNPSPSDAAGHIWHDVEMLPWPGAESRRAVLHQARIPRLLLVREGCEPPITEDHYEDWIRTPSDPRDVQARAFALRSRAARDVVPRLDEDGCLHVEGRWIALSPIEYELVGQLLSNFGGVIDRATLQTRAWPSTRPARNQLDVQIVRLRKRLAAVRLTIRAVYSKGYCLERETEHRMDPPKTRR